MLTLNFMKNVFDAIDVGVTVTDDQGNIIYVNAAQLNRSHYTYQEYMNLNVRTLYETKVSDTCLFDVVMEHKKAVSAIQRTYHKSDGSSYEKLVTATPLSRGNPWLKTPRSVVVPPTSMTTASSMRDR